MISKELYNEVGGFSEEYAVAFNDVDFCMKVREKGYLVVYDAFSQWYHYESKSRGLDDTAEKMERFKGEVDRFQAKWKKQLMTQETHIIIRISHLRKLYLCWIKNSWL